MSKVGLLDPNEQHTLSQHECELVSLYRALREVEQKAVIQAVFQLLHDRKLAERAKKQEEAKSYQSRYSLI